jgi:hypothetical protein
LNTHRSRPHNQSPAFTAPNFLQKRMHVSTAHKILTLALSAAAFAQVLPKDREAMGKMWTFETPPLAYLEQEYGFKPDQRWLDSLRLASLRLGERDNSWCSASFVSPKGLIMTNHHCVRDQITVLQADRDWLGNGFGAKSLLGEVPIRGLTVQQLVAMEDVTAELQADISPNDDPDVIAIKRDTNRVRVQQAADLAHPGYRNQIVPLFQGAITHLYRYRVYDDIRLVMAVHLQTAQFGGDPDNFTFPRWSADFAFVRAYEKNAPADTSANWFRWRQTGIAEGDPVFVPGNPGNTSRLMTVTQLECQRDIEQPIQLEELTHGIQIIQPKAARSEALRMTVLNWQNSRKAVRYIERGLESTTNMQQKRDQETRFRAAIDGNPELKAQYGDAWQILDALVMRRRALIPRITFHAASYSPVIQRSLLLAKAFDPARDDLQRSEAMQEAMAMPADTNSLLMAMAADHFERAANWLPNNDPYLVAVAGAQHGRTTINWQAAIAALDQSSLRDSKFVKRIVEGGAALFALETDPGVRVGQTLLPLTQNDEVEMRAVDALISVQAARIGRALYAMHGDGLSPDATMTLRFSDGRVQGYEYNGTRAPAATSLYGLFARNVEFEGAAPFDLPKAWLDARDRLDLRKRMCFASTNDIVGGNSGSCVVDQNLQVCGLVFDGNIESLPNDFYYSSARARAVSVHSEVILEALEKVYQLPLLVNELRGSGPTNK